VISSVRKEMKRLAIVALALLPALATAKARQVDDHHWTDVERIVAIGDIHGDWDQYMRVMTAAGLVNSRGSWTGGETHLVQTGDIPDRGPDTRRVIDHLQKLKKEASRKGGAVHTLIGNHEAMNVYGDLRYVTSGEYQAFTGKNSEKYQELQWEHHLSVLQQRDPEAFEALDLESFRAKWEADYPLGWVEHRQAWSPTGEYGRLVMENPAVIQVNDTLFLHGGLSAKYCAYSLAEITGMVHDKLAHFDFQDTGILEDELGPLWYRGLATDDEDLRGDMVGAVLEHYGARRMVVGHTPTQGVVWPRFDSRVILNDVGLAAYYGGHTAFLEITPAGAMAHYPGGMLDIPADRAGRLDYLQAVVKMDPTNPHLQARLQRMVMAKDGPAAPEPVEEETSEPMTEEQRQAAADAAQVEAWLSPDNCR